MKISIITTSFNSVKTIENTIKSVISQSYPDIEYIIIDGSSTDGTLDIIKKYGNKISKVISEKDDGIYDAMNKGIKLATGEVVGILNSDDFYFSKDTLQIVIDKMIETKADCVWGDLIYVDQYNTNKVVRNWKSSPYKEGSFQRGWHPPHPTFFVKKNIYDKYGLFREDLSTSADFELMLRFLERYKITSSYIPQTLVKMRTGGASDKNYWNIIKNNILCYNAFKINKLKVNPLIIFIKPFSKLKQCVVADYLYRVRRIIVNIYIDLKYCGHYLGGTFKSDIYEFANRGDSSSYESLNLMFKDIEIKDNDVIVDVGCGKGRLLNWLVSKGIKNKAYGFEINTKWANKVRRIFKQYKTINIINSDIILDFPKDATIFYLFNPFTQQKVFEFIEKIKEVSLEKQDVTIIYYNPVFLSLFMKQEFFDINKKILSNKFIHDYVIIKSHINKHD